MSMKQVATVVRIRANTAVIELTNNHRHITVCRDGLNELAGFRVTKPQRVYFDAHPKGEWSWLYAGFRSKYDRLGVVLTSFAIDTAMKALELQDKKFDIYFEEIEQ